MQLNLGDGVLKVCTNFQWSMSHLTVAPVILVRFKAVGPIAGGASRAAATLPAADGEVFTLFEELIHRISKVTS